ncbi:MULTISPECIES: hypothetical protein [unclassified Curtobacterium]|uniref:hypothetical protein n=1 Tax=unclassified Curtobacterium TaxID=257496 RepID=UPI003805D8DA
MAMQKKHMVAWGLGLAILAGGIAPAVSGTTEVTALTKNTHRYANENACKNDLGIARLKGYPITQGCTYAGPYFGPIKTAAGPYIAVY